MTNDACSLGDGKPARARGWCYTHYMRWYVHGDPLATKRIIGDDRARFESRVDRSGGPDACHPWLGGRRTGGYGYFWMDGRMQSAHAAAWNFANPAASPGQELDHECHNKAVREGTCSPGPCPHRLCCNERHLRPKTRQQHVGDTEPFAHARRTRHGRAKLTELQVAEIRASGETSTALAERYGVARSTIRAVRTGQTWR